MYRYKYVEKNVTKKKNKKKFKKIARYSRIVTIFAPSN